MNCDFQSFGMGLAFVFFMIFIPILVLLASNFLLSYVLVMGPVAWFFLLCLPACKKTT